MAATNPAGTSGSDRAGQLSLVRPGPLNVTLQQLNQTAIHRVAYCRHDDPDPPFDPPYTSSLNYTFPDTPAINRSFLESVGFVVGEDDYAFDCFVEIPGGIVVFEVC